MLDFQREERVCKPEAVIFDTDNTLYPYHPAHEAAIENVAKKAATIFNINENDFLQALEVSRNEVKSRLGNTASSHSRLLYFQRTIEHLDLGTRIFTTLDLEQTYWRTFLANTRLFPGVKEFLQKLRNNGVKTANITDLTAQIQFRKMVYFGLDEYFDYVVTSEEAGCDKPNVLPFEIALKKLDIPAGKIWMIGDDAEADMVGADMVCMIKVQKKHQGVSIGLSGSKKADLVFENYNELFELV